MVQLSAYNAHSISEKNPIPNESNGIILYTRRYRFDIGVCFNTTLKRHAFYTDSVLDIFNV